MVGITRALSNTHINAHTSVDVSQHGEGQMDDESEFAQPQPRSQTRRGAAVVESERAPTRQTNRAGREEMKMQAATGAVETNTNEIKRGRSGGKKRTQ